VGSFFMFLILVLITIISSFVIKQPLFGMGIFISVPIPMFPLFLTLAIINYNALF
jgi:hypothetical protein